MRLLYFFGFVFLLACFGLNAAALAGYDLINVGLVLWLPTLTLHFVLVGNGFYSPSKEFRIRWRATWRWVMRRLPPWCRYVVWAFWGYFVAINGALIIYLTTHCQVHGDRCAYAFLHSRLATPFEMRLDHTWVVLFMTNLPIQLFIFPALYFLFETPEERQTAQ